MKVKVTHRGLKTIDANLSRLGRSGVLIARASVNSGLNVLSTSAKNAAPGTISREVGKYVRVTGETAWGKAGLMQFPRPGDGQNGPHGVYVDQGTKFIQARHFIGRAIRSAFPRAIQAASSAAARVAQKIVNRK